MRVRVAVLGDVPNIFKMSADLSEVKNIDRRNEMIVGAIFNHNHVVLVADEGGHLSGYLNANVRVSILNECLMYVISGLYVTPDCRNQGVAKALLMELQHMARQRGISCIVVQTSPNNEIAKATYLSVGFIDRNVLEFYWRS